MRQCDHPPCQTDGRLWDGDKVYCIWHFEPRKRTVPNTKAATGPVDRGGKPISGRKKVASKR
jgi:hypothetical protein